MWPESLALFSRIKLLQMPQGVLPLLPDPPPSLFTTWKQTCTKKIEETIMGDFMTVSTSVLRSCKISRENTDYALTLNVLREVEFNSSRRSKTRSTSYTLLHVFPPPVNSHQETGARVQSRWLPHYTFYHSCSEPRAVQGNLWS